MTFPAISLPTKNEQAQQDAQEKSEKLEQLDEKIRELERFIQFSEVNKLLEENEEQRQNVKNIYLIDVTINKINKLIRELSQPTQLKLEQLKFLKKFTEEYFDACEVNQINGILTIHYKKLQNELDSHVINKELIAKKIIDTDQVLVGIHKKIFGKILEYFQNKEVICNYVECKSKLIEYFLDQDKNQPKDNIDPLFPTIKYLEKSIKEFDTSLQEFHKRLTCLGCYEEELNNVKFVESNHKKTKSEILDSFDTIKSFNPLEDSFDILDEQLNSLRQRLDDLYKLNYAELQKQQCNLIELIKISKDKLAKHVEEKLSQSTSKCAELKRHRINVINAKINILINNEVNPDGDAINSNMSDNISELKQTIEKAKVILSEYRGISFLRCVASFFGGGKVRSEELVNELEEQLTDLQSNINNQPLRL